MCGIAGFAGSIFSQDDLQKNIRKACQALRHRGPDQEGVYVDKDVALGVSRLSIRDPKNGIQPMIRQGMTLTFNGELYGSDSLKQRLLSAGYPFESNSDTEIFLYALLEFGIPIVREIVGMFAFALWDSNSKTLTIGRDRWGEKPLYYTANEQFLAFASEIKGLQVWPNLEWDISLEDIRIFLKYSYLPNPRTGWKNIFKLRQGSIITWKEGKLSKHTYFCPLIEKKKCEEHAVKHQFKTLHPSEELFHLISSSVKNCLVADRPVGAFLSGGIDSTTVAYFLSQHQRNFPVFSLHWDEEAYSEEIYTTKAVQALGLKHHIVKCDPFFLMNHFDAIVNLYDEPFADESMIPTYCLARFAKQTVDVVLTGDGADEFFHGYERYFFQGSFENYLDTFAATSNKTLELICHPDFMHEADPDEPFSQYYLQAKPHIEESRLRSWVDINTYLTDDILMKVDRACMAVGLEARAPFLTPQVTDFALSCSMQQLIGNRVRGKEVLRSAMKDHLPKPILERKKMGFGIPLHRWFQSSLKDWMMHRLFDGHMLKTGWFSKEEIAKLVSSKSYFSRTIFNLLVLQTWLESAQKKYRI